MRARDMEVQSQKLERLWLPCQRGMGFYPGSTGELPRVLRWKRAQSRSVFGKSTHSANVKINGWGVGGEGRTARSFRNEKRK